MIILFIAALLLVLPGDPLLKFLVLMTILAMDAIFND